MPKETLTVRVNRLEQLAQVLLKSQIETGKQFRETARQFRETDRRVVELRKQGEETDRRLRELGAETDRRIQDLVSAIGEYLRRNGK